MRSLDFASPEIRAITEHEAPAKIRTHRDYASAEKEVGALSRAGKLADSTVNRFAVGQDHESLTAALALLSQAPSRQIHAPARRLSPPRHQ
jgi:hypothetical protein